jgi:hypothetical protein
MLARGLTLLVASGIYRLGAAAVDVILALVVGASPYVVSDGVGAFVECLARREGHQNSVFAMGAFGKFHRKTLLKIKRFAILQKWLMSHN